MKQSTSYTTIRIGTFLWCLFLFVPPLISSFENMSNVISVRLYHFFSSICHQYDSRSLHLLGYKLAVCVRCLAIYLGFFVGTCFIQFRQKKYEASIALPLFIAVLPMLADVILDLLNIHSSNTMTRLLTGAIFGVVAARVLVPIGIEGLNELIADYHRLKGVNYESKTS